MSTGTNKERIEQNNLLLEDIKEQIHNLPETGGGSTLNVFMQLEAPATKNGIWIKSLETFDNIICDTNVYTGGYFDMDKSTTIPSNISYNYINGIIAVYDNMLYMIGGWGQSAGGMNYTNYVKMDLTTKAMTHTTSSMTRPSGSAYAQIGNVLWCFGNDDNSFATYISTYTISSSGSLSYQRLSTTFPEYMKWGSAAAYDDRYIFIVGGVGNGSVDLPYIYKFDTQSGTLTKEYELDYRPGAKPSLAFYGNDLYIFGGNTANYTAIKYDIVNKTVTSLEDTPVKIGDGTASIVGDNIYMFGGLADDSHVNTVMYNIKTNTYSLLEPLPHAMYRNASFVKDDCIYVIGGSDGDSRGIYCFQLSSTDYDTNTVIVNQGFKAKYKTKLINNGYNLNSYYENVCLYKINTGFDTTTNIYNGNGTEWIKIGGTE